MQYLSTRGNAPQVNSLEALINGIAPDGGLYVPETFPQLDSNGLCGGDYASILRAVLAIFFDDFPAEIRDAAVANSTSRFKEQSCASLSPCGNGAYFLNLFHGPTLAFKDFALTVLPHLLKYAARERGLERVAVLTATSGDTGSAAMSGFSDVAGTEVLVFYPQTGISELQRRQMVCCPGGNVHACAILGNFDDAQTGVKSAFVNQALRERAARNGVFLSSANSINIGRLFPQIAYYLEAWRQLKEKGALGGEARFDVVVPTGNFGNILAASLAKKLGAPIRNLIVASNENDVISEFIQTGIYDARREFKITNSPSMDILYSSNVERLLFALSEQNPKRVSELMESLKTRAYFELNSAEKEKMQAVYRAGSATEKETEEAIRAIWEKFAYLADPHTAVAWKVAQEYREESVPVLIAATAAPWKFPSTVLRALTGTVGADEFLNLKALSELSQHPAQLGELETQTIEHQTSCEKNQIVETICKIFKI